MTDDLVKCLRDSCYLAFDDGTNDYGTAEEAADRIEKLEALVEQLRNDNSSMIDDYDTDFLRQEKRIKKLEAALREIAEAVGDPSAYWIARKALGGKDD